MKEYLNGVCAKNTLLSPSHYINTTTFKCSLKGLWLMLPSSRSGNVQ